MDKGKIPNPDEIPYNDDVQGELTLTCLQTALKYQSLVKKTGDFCGRRNTSVLCDSKVHIQFTLHFMPPLHIWVHAFP